MLDLNLWEQAAKFHGHKCPGLAIGFKASEGAIDQLGLSAKDWPAFDEEIVCVTENDACGVDAIQLILSCTFGKSNLITRLRGKMAFSFFIRNNEAGNNKCGATKRAVRLVLTAKSPLGASREEFMNYLLSTPYDNLFSIKEPHYDLPESARMFKSHDCAACGESTAEYALRVQDSRLVCADCYNAYDREGLGG
ncbi:MAG: FmdE family protein [Coriobacteriales bacterium]|jgi:formylmethanofuran dehydrogenase subunit E|nr:FmdE family protein [Coriobacteriales bacterium]